MTITLPDDPAIIALDVEDIRIDLACGAYSAGHVSRGVAARMAGLSLEDFDEILQKRRISVFTEAALSEDLEALRDLGRR
jgi:predicted HTH domain antitoxin